VSLEACLPVELQGPSASITRVAAGLSGAGVHRVDVAGQAFLLKISAGSESLAGWRRKLHVQKLAADAGLAPPVVHADEARRAVLSAYVVDRSFPAFYANPSTHEAALAELGRTLRRVHELQLPADADSKEPRAFLADTWSELERDFELPAFVADAVNRALAEPAPASERPVVLSHNDVNPTNLVYDGARILLLDWDTAGPNDPFYDLAAISVFLRMDEDTCRRLLAAHDAEKIPTLPARFTYDRRIVAVLCGATFLKLARNSGHAGALGGETLETTLSLGDFYQKLRSGHSSIGSADGQWSFGLALIKAGLVD